jgi:hypothetical protein
MTKETQKILFLELKEHLAQTGIEVADIANTGEIQIGDGISMLAPVGDDATVPIEITMGKLADDIGYVQFRTIIAADSVADFGALRDMTSELTLDCPLGAFGALDEDGKRTVYHRFSFLTDNVCSVEHLLLESLRALTAISDTIGFYYKHIFAAALPPDARVLRSRD